MQEETSERFITWRSVHQSGQSRCLHGVLKVNRKEYSSWHPSSWMLAACSLNTVFVHENVGSFFICKWGNALALWLAIIQAELDVVSSVHILASEDVCAHACVRVRACVRASVFVCRAEEEMDV